MDWHEQGKPEELGDGIVLVSFSHHRLGWDRTRASTVEGRATNRLKHGTDSEAWSTSELCFKSQFVTQQTHQPAGSSRHGWLRFTVKILRNAQTDCIVSKSVELFEVKAGSTYIYHYYLKV